MLKQLDHHLHIIFIVTLGIRYLQLLTDLSTEGLLALVYTKTLQCSD